MKTSAYSRRLRNAHLHGEKQKESFFSHSSDRDQKPFFNTPQTSAQPIQAKLAIGKPDDQYEQEADRVASKVVAKSAQSPDVQQQEADSVQRSTAEGRMEKDKLIQEKIQKMDVQEEEVQAKQEEEEVQTKEEDELQAKQEEEEVQAKQDEEEPVQAKSEAGRVASNGVTQKIKSSAGGGRPLSGEALAGMERAFGADFSRVRIHTDADAVQLNKQLRSQAFTRGQDVFFNEGKYRPETSEGRLLLAHELTHVIQQCGRRTNSPSAK